jgi:hypothetical protein
MGEWQLWCRFLGRYARRLSDADRRLASEKRSSGKSWGWAWWVACCYGDLRSGDAFARSCHTGLAGRIGLFTAPTLSAVG